MKSLRPLLAIGFVAALFTASPAANAAQIGMCAPDAVASATGGRRVVNPVTQNAYSLNSAGCALIGSADVGYFISQGYTQQSSQNSIVYTTGVATGTTNFVIGVLPAKAYIQQIIFSNSVAATAGTISIGSSSGGTQIVTGTSVGSSADVAATIGLPVSATAVATTLNMSSTAWNSSNVTVTVIFGYY